MKSILKEILKKGQVGFVEDKNSIMLAGGMTNVIVQENLDRAVTFHFGEDGKLSHVSLVD